MQDEKEIILQNERERGLIVFLHGDRFGFIRTGLDEQDMFFHEGGVLNYQFDDLREGMMVSFIRISKYDKVKAIAVEVVE